MVARKRKTHIPPRFKKNKKYKNLIYYHNKQQARISKMQETKKTSLRTPYPSLQPLPSPPIN